MENDNERPETRPVFIWPADSAAPLQQGMHHKVPPGCEVTISYHAARPEEPVVSLPKPGQGCEGAEVAISIILTALVRQSFEPPEK